MEKVLLIKIFLIFRVFLVIKCCNGFANDSYNQIFALSDEIEYQNTTNLSINDWISQINKEYELFNQYSSFYVWELNMNSFNSYFYNDASKLGGIHNKWKNQRCTQSKNYYEQMTLIQKRMIYLLCRGPKYNDYQAGELSLILNKIQTLYTDIQICLPKSFDTCINYNRIWDYTYVKLPDQYDFIHLDMSFLMPKNKIDYNPLNSYDIKSNNDKNDDYYVFRGIDKNLINSVDENSTQKNIYNKKQFLCMNIEPQLENIMSGDFSSFKRPDCALASDVLLKWSWESWRLASGQQIAKYYPDAIDLMNSGAKNNGYHDIGECWREELEMLNLRSTIEKLWENFKPFYKKFHAVLRNAFRKKLFIFKGKDKIQPDGLLPAHLLGNMWSQDWSSYTSFLNPFTEFDIDKNFEAINWTITGMVKRADDFYRSLGLKKMTKNFWKYSKFEKTSKSSKCHGSAANMFKNDDFRITLCAEKKLKDFYVIIHELGHIQYYMYSNLQPPLFRDATNSAFGEAIGDAIFLAMMTPHHLNRLGLLPDKLLFTEKLTLSKLMNLINDMRFVHEIKKNNLFMNYKIKIDHDENNEKNDSNENLQNISLDEYNFDKNIPQQLIFANNNKIYDEINDDLINFKNNEEISSSQMMINTFDLSLLMRIGLMKLPQIPYEYILDIYRWDLFSGEISFENSNSYYWKLRENEQGVKPPENRDNKFLFDAGSKFHIADNTPYVRYFLSSFLQAQIFKGLCEKTVFNQVNTNEKLPMPLHRCDIYGSKRAGLILKQAMKRGASAHWTEILFILTGKREITIDSLIEYYEPLFKWIDKLINDFNIPVGW